VSKQAAAPEATSASGAGRSAGRVVPLDLSLPKASYTDQAMFGRERDEVLFRDWFCVGREQSLAAEGDYLTADVAGESIIVVRGDDWRLTAFYNVCRHRGSRLVPPEDAVPDANYAVPAGSGRSGCFAGSIRCPYHAWTYGLDGSLRSAPFLPDLRGYRKALSLHQVDVGTWGGFVFVRLEPGAGEPLEENVGEIGGRVARYELGGLRRGASIRYDVAANWKVILENYNECYHCGPVHPELCELVPQFARGGADLDWEDGIPHRPGAYTFTRTGTTTRLPLPGLTAAERERHKGELILPNLMLSLSADHVAAFTVWPRAAGRSTVVCDFLFHPDELARPGFDPSDAVSFWDVVNRQDWAICERVQDGMSSRRFSRGYLAPMEDASADVGRYVAARLGIDLQRRGGE
jgi:glycine betaine catabolism A